MAAQPLPLKIDITEHITGNDPDLEYIKPLGAGGQAHVYEVHLYNNN
jgi:hypothetical protein